MTADRLLDVDPHERVITTKALVHVPADRCPDCGCELDHETVHEDALLRHGGYGATRTSTRRHCHCGWTLHATTAETRPPRPGDA